MFPASSLLSLLVVAISLGSVSAAPNPNLARDTPTVSLAFRTNVNVTGFTNIVAADQARAAALRANAVSRANARALGKRASSFDVTNTAVTYTASVGVGSPATDCNVIFIITRSLGLMCIRATDTLLIDTGSSNTWVGADKNYVKTSTSKSTGKSVVCNRSKLLIQIGSESTFVQSVSYGSGSFSGTECEFKMICMGDGIAHAS